MNFRDRWAENDQGERFVFTVELQRRLSEAGLPVLPSEVAKLEPQSGRATRPSGPIDRSPKSAERLSGQPALEEEKPSSRPVSSKDTEITGPETIQIDPMTGKYIGRVKWYNTKKGYGFILRGAGEEIFFHKSGTVGEMEEFEDGQWILYDVEDTNKGPEATDVESYTGEPIE
jgi:CspA family cold shock protein